MDRSPIVFEDLLQEKRFEVGEGGALFLCFTEKIIGLVEEYSRYFRLFNC